MTLVLLIPVILLLLAMPLSLIFVKYETKDGIAQTKPSDSVEVIVDNLDKFQGMYNGTYSDKEIIYVPRVEEPHIYGKYFDSTGKCRELTEVYGEKKDKWYLKNYDFQNFLLQSERWQTKNMGNLMVGQRCKLLI